MSERAAEIECTACGQTAWIRREPVYEGFKKTGERLFCSACGHEYASEDALPVKGCTGVNVFTDDDKGPRVEVFDEAEKTRNCRHCKHYVVNPFTQRCGLHGTVVEATDVCDAFERKPAQEDGEAEA